MLDSGEARDLIARISDEGERRVACLLLDMGPGFTGANVELQNHPEPVAGEIDLIFQSGHILLLVEAGTGRHSISDKKQKFFSKWEDRPNVEALKNGVNCNSRGQSGHTLICGRNRKIPARPRRRE